MSNQLTERAIALWRSHGGPSSGEVSAQLCAASGNNRVIMLEAPGHGKVVAKCYFREATGSSSRLTAEWRFLRFTAETGIATTPRPIACAPDELIAIYEFVDGRKLNSEEIGEREVLIAADFINALNRYTSLKSATELPKAAEACFSIAEHFTTVDRRITRLAGIQPALTIDFEAADFAAELSARWTTIKQQLTQAAQKMGIDIAHPLPMLERIISPSDFGFHNALLRPDGSMAFIDFEYAGWDDIAKLSADFFFQPAIPVSPAYYEIFMMRLTEGLSNAEQVRRRCRLLRPIFGVKWCCIMLNRFLPDMIARSRFADPEHDESERKLLQLEKAQRAFDNLEKTSWLT